jgi:hypothetical protein
MRNYPRIATYSQVKWYMSRRAAESITECDKCPHAAYAVRPLVFVEERAGEWFAVVAVVVGIPDVAGCEVASVDRCK